MRYVLRFVQLDGDVHVRFLECLLVFEMIKEVLLLLPQKTVDHFFVVSSQVED